MAIGPQINILRSDPRVQLANNANRLAALRTALLLLPTEFTTHDLLTHIVGLSYSGDFRTMIGAENPNKVSNIATAQAELLWEIYGPLVDQLNDVLVRRSADNWVQATDPKTRARLVANLPLAFRRRIYEQFSRTGSVAIGKDGAADQGSLAMGVASSLEMSEWIRKALVRTVAYPALTQSIKGIATAGILRSVTYSFEKLKKGRQKS